MYLTANPHADAEAYFSDMQDHTDRLHSIEAEAGSAFRAALAWGSGEGLGLRSIRDRMAGEVIAELAATEEGCEAITKALATLAQSKDPAAVGAIWSLSDVWVSIVKKEIEHAAE
jgi:signal transduction histidine kinase